MDPAKPPLPDEESFRVTPTHPPTRVQSDRVYLLALPTEILKLICHELVNINPILEDSPSINREWLSLSNLGRTCKRLRKIILPILYRDIRSDQGLWWINGSLSFLSFLRSLFETPDLRSHIRSVDIIRNFRYDDLYFWSRKGEWAFANDAKSLFYQLIAEFLSSFVVHSLPPPSSRSVEMVNHPYLSTDIQTALLLGVLSESIRAVRLPRRVDNHIKLNLKSTTSFPSLRVLDLDFVCGFSDIALFVIRHSPSLHSLRLFDLTRENYYHPPYELPDLPLLKSLSIFDFEYFQTDDTLETIIKCCKHLTHFKVSDGCSRMVTSATTVSRESSQAFSVLESLTYVSSTLETIMIGPCPRTAEDVDELTSFGNFPHLKTIGVWSGNIVWGRDTPLVELVEGCSELETLMIFQAEIGVTFEGDASHFKRALSELAHAAIGQRFPHLNKLQISFQRYPDSWDDAGAGPDGSTGRGGDHAVHEGDGGSDDGGDDDGDDGSNDGGDDGSNVGYDYGNGDISNDGANDSSDNGNDDGIDEGSDDGLDPAMRRGMVDPETFRGFARLFRSAGVLFSVLKEDSSFEEDVGEEPDDTLAYCDEFNFSLE